MFPFNYPFFFTVIVPINLNSQYKPESKHLQPESCHRHGELCSIKTWKGLLGEFFTRKRYIKISYFSAKVGCDKSQQSPYVPPGLPVAQKGWRAVLAGRQAGHLLPVNSAHSHTKKRFTNWLRCCCSELKSHFFQIKKMLKNKLRRISVNFFYSLMILSAMSCGTWGAVHKLRSLCITRCKEN